jgi:hypothetical protein
MEQEIKNIIITQNFSSLSQKERDLIEEWCSDEEEFNALKYMLSEVEGIISEEKIVASTETKASLDKLFHEKYKKRGGVIYHLYPRDKHFVQRPVVQLAAACLLFFIALPFFRNESQFTNESNQIAEHKVQSKESSEKELKLIVPEEKVTEAFNSTSKNDDNFMISKNGLLDKKVQVEQNFMRMDSEMEVSEDAMMRPSFKNIEMNEDESPISSTSIMHSDLGFDSNEKNINYSISVKANRNVLDLLTASF